VIRADLLAGGASADDLSQMLARADAGFRDKAPLSVTGAATIILDGAIRTWRILAGEDAGSPGTLLRARSWTACDYAGLFSAVAGKPAAGTPGQ
jgi:hypothetical protein